MTKAGLAPEILKMDSWTHMGRTANIIIKDIVHIFASFSKNMHILLMRRRYRERWLKVWNCITSTVNIVIADGLVCNKAPGHYQERYWTNPYRNGWDILPTYPIGSNFLHGRPSTTNTWPSSEPVMRNLPFGVNLNTKEILWVLGIVVSNIKISLLFWFLNSLWPDDTLKKSVNCIIIDSANDLPPIQCQAIT